jgi:hypothetical protein
METCEDCGFAWEIVPREAIGGRVASGAIAIAERLRATSDDVSGRRPEPERWSMTEYAAHVRDVLLTLRDRCVIGLVEDNPGFSPMYRDERVTLGLYRNDTPAAVATDVEVSAAMFVRLFDAIDDGAIERPVRYGYPGPIPRTILWMGQQAVHEVEHHRADIDENHRALG